MAQQSRNEVQGPSAAPIRNKGDRQPRFATFIAVTLSAMVGAIFALAANTQVPQVTRAPGVIVPLGNYSQIESLEGGIVKAVLVADGEMVEAGTALLELRNPQLIREEQSIFKALEEARRRHSNAAAVRAALSSTPPNMSRAWRQLEMKDLSQAAARLQIYYMGQQIAASSIEQKQNTVDILTGAAQFAKERSERHLANLTKKQALFDRGLITTNEFQNAEMQTDNLMAQASDAEVRLAEAQEALALAIAERETKALSFREENLQEIADLEAEINRLSSEYTIARERLEQQRVLAPSRGVIQAVSYPSVGEVIEPGETVFDLLPTRQSLVVEAKIPNIDIGHIGVGQTVSVSFDSFDVRRFGKVEGRLVSFSPVPLVDETSGEQYFRAFIELSDSSVGQGASQRPIQAGLTTVSEMVIGEHSLLSYFLKPVERTLGRAFTER